MNFFDKWLNIWQSYKKKTWLSRELTLSFSGVVDEKTAFFSGNFSKYSAI